MSMFDPSRDDGARLEGGVTAVLLWAGVWRWVLRASTGGIPDRVFKGQHQGQGRHCMPLWFPLLAKDARNGAPFLDSGGWRQGQDQGQRQKRAGEGARSTRARPYTSETWPGYRVLKSPLLAKDARNGAPTTGIVAGPSPSRTPVENSRK